MKLKAPFPWFGGKSLVADLVWDRFGNVSNYVEPFFGSGAVLLARPHAPQIETVNDRDCMVANFWRSLQQAPDEVASHADNPVNEADKHARHLWLTQQEKFRERMKTDPDFYDPKIAGWWVWGLSIWIGAGWCSAPHNRKRPHLGNSGKGVHRQLPHLRGSRGVQRQLPHLRNAGMGVQRQLPHLSNAGMGIHRESAIAQYMRALSERLRRVRVCCGDWSRITGPSVTFKNGVTGVFLDPPYASEREKVYAHDSADIGRDVTAWAVENGDNPELRIALCGYEGDCSMPGSWTCIPWKATGGYGLQGEGRGRRNAGRERIWFSPYCLDEPLFRGLEEQAS